MIDSRSETGWPVFGFDGAFLQRLERVTLANRRPLPGLNAGPRRSPRYGSSVEFADFRDYSDGDDFRRIDWNAYARLDRLFLRLYRAEEMATITILLDHSASMRFGEPTKALAAARLAAIFAYVAAHNYDSVALAAWGERIDRFLPARSGKAAIPELWRGIARMLEEPSGGTDATALRGYGRYRSGRGLSIVLSDLLTDTDWQAGLRSLLAQGQDVTVVQVLAPEELAPELRGDWKLVDVESDGAVEVTISPRLLRRYQDELAAHLGQIRDFCRRHAIAHALVSSDRSMTAVLTDLRAAGVLG